MAVKKLLDYLTPAAPLSGGGFSISKTTPAVMPNTFVSPGSVTAAAAPAPAGMSAEQQAALRALGARNAAPVAPVAPVAPAGPTAPAYTSLFTGPTGPTAPTGATGSTIPPQYLNADGSFKSPDQVASDIAGTLQAAHGNGDVGTLALNQFGGGDKSASELATDARRIGNTRNDIAVGETDPYGVASKSGIAYTAAELNAIEKAYAGIYDPALDTALAKVTDKQASDKAAAAAAATANAPYTLGKGDIRYDGKGNIIAVGSGSTGAAGGTYVAGQNPVVDAYIKGFQSGTYKASDIPDEYKDLVAQGISAATGANAPLSKSATDALGIIAQIQGSPDGALSALSGKQGLLPVIPGTPAATLSNLTKQLQATISLANRQQLKGSGAISDFEFKVLGDAATALGLDGNGHTNLSAEDFKSQLAKLELKLRVGQTNLTDDEVQYLDSQGYTVDQIRDYSSKQSFNDVGNTTASTSTGKGNLPQRNNNPGDIKSGSMADKLAVGKDAQGHLIFPDAATGFQALHNDLEAKIAGTGRLPANPTIAELGKVYAEDPNWPIKVAAIIGVPVDTHTGTIPLDKLVRAVATQEGFFA